MTVGPKSPDGLQPPWRSAAASSHPPVGLSLDPAHSSTHPPPPDDARWPVFLALTGPQLGAAFVLDMPRAIIGRDADVEVVLNDDTVSVRHAIVTQTEDGTQIEDHGSRNGTFVNGKRLGGPKCLVDGDRVRVGTFNILKFFFADELECRALSILSDLTMLDPLTRLFNRRYFGRRLRSELSFAVRYRMGMAVLLVDVERFALLNDTHGHVGGDLVLKLVARTLERLMRPEDVLARFGGDEFIMIARVTSLRNAEILGQRICQRVAAAMVAGRRAPLRASVSVGAAWLDPYTRDVSAQGLIDASHDALSRAKAAGRHGGVVCHVSSASGPDDLAGRRTTPDASTT